MEPFASSGHSSLSVRSDRSQRSRRLHGPASGKGEFLSRPLAIALVMRLVDAAARRDLSEVMCCYADNAVAVSPVFGEVRGRTAIATTWGTTFSTLYEPDIGVQDVLVDGNRIAVLSTVKTTDRMGWFGHPPTGTRIEYRLLLLLTIHGGRITRDERVYDSTGVLERIEKARYESELRTAAEVQRVLSSRTVHSARFCECVGDSLPCRTIGGDFFEFLDLPSGTVGMIIGDVAGKGPAAALLASMIQGMLAAEGPAERGPAATLARINRYLIERHLEPRFATMVFAILCADGRLVYANAGHNPPALVMGDHVQRLTTGGPILGVFADAVFAEESLHMDRGNTLVMFTDGVTEACNRRDEEFGEERLIARAHVRSNAQPRDLLTSIFTAVREFCEGTEQRDDITATATRFL